MIYFCKLFKQVKMSVCLLIILWIDILIIKKCKIQNISILDDLIKVLELIYLKSINRVFYAFNSYLIKREFALKKQ